MKTSTKHNKTILGIDPGTSITGYGIIHLVNKNIDLIDSGIINLEKETSVYLKLKKIYTQITVLIKKYQPEEAAIEAPFYGKNAQSMLKLGRAQGMAIIAALNYNIPVFEYAPKKIKLSITGRGYASKDQVAAMLKQMLYFKEPPKYLDITDAIAVAVCHSLQNNISKQSGKKYKNWDRFLSEHPEKIKK